MNDLYIRSALNHKGYNYLYISILLFSTTFITSLPFIHTDISIKSMGITRPVTERTDVKPIMTGIIDTIYFMEGDMVNKDAVILRLKDPNTKGKLLMNNFEISQREQFIHDLVILTSSVDLEFGTIDKLTAPLYKQQLAKFTHQKQDLDASINKAKKELDINTPLAKDKIISGKEFYDIQINYQKFQSSYKAFVQEQLSTWQQDLARYKLELSQYKQNLSVVNTDATYYLVKAPTSGIIQGINTRYQGGLLQANEPLCTISPEGDLIGECYVPTRDIGLLKVGQPVRYQMEAFDYNYFGVLTGKVAAIDNDFTVINNTPVFKVRCSFDSTQLHLKNGFTGTLKKGLNFQARFIVARRSLWQLLYDNLDDWLNPNAPPNTTTAAN
jgi:membrane fusion protein, peptide pheromone/bacteriocin exporter